MKSSLRFATVATSLLLVVLSGCANQAAARVPALCKRFTDATEQQDCISRLRDAQNACKKDVIAFRKNPANKGKKFPVFKCIQERMATSAKNPLQKKGSASSR